MTVETREHYIRVAEKFGLSHKEPEMTRRSFLRGLAATGALVAMPPTGLLVPREPKIHQVAVVSPVLKHIRFLDGREILVRDFGEDDEFDTVEYRVADKALLEPTILNANGDLPLHAPEFTWKDAGPMVGLGMAAIGMMYALAGEKAE